MIWRMKVIVTALLLVGLPSLYVEAELKSGGAETAPAGPVAMQPLPMSRLPGQPGVPSLQPWLSPSAAPFRVADVASCRKKCQAAFDKCEDRCGDLYGNNSSDYGGCQEDCFQKKVSCRAAC